MLRTLLEIGRSEGEGGTKNPVEAYYSPSKSFRHAEVFVVKVRIDKNANRLIPFEVEKVEFSRDDNSSRFLYTDREIERSKPNPTKSLAKNRIQDIKPLAGVRMVVYFAIASLQLDMSSDDRTELISWMDEKIKASLSVVPAGERRANDYLVTMRIEEKDHDTEASGAKFLAELDSTRSMLSGNFAEVVELPQPHACALCNNKERKIAQYNFFGLYTLDRPGFAPHGNRDFGITLFPLCESCVSAIINAERWVYEYASFRLYDGIKYFVLPVVNYPAYFDEEYTEGVSHFLRVFESSITDLVQIGISDLFEIEEKVIQSIGTNNRVYSNWNVTLSYVFFQTNNSAKVVRMRLDGVLPSRISELVTTLKTVSASESEPNFTLRTFSDVFVNPKAGKAKLFGRNNPGESKMLLEILEKAHLGPSVGKIRWSIFIESLVRNVRGFYGLLRRERLKERLLLREFDTFVNKTLAITVFLYVVSSLESQSSLQVLPKSDAQTQNLGGNSAEKFFQIHSQLFENPKKRWAFLIGVVSRKLVDFQVAERGASPFLSRIGDMNFDTKRLETLYKDVIEKFAAYKESLQYFRQRVSYLSEMIADNSDDAANVSNDDLSYFFALGFGSGSRKF